MRTAVALCCAILAAVALSLALGSAAAVAAAAPAAVPAPSAGPAPSANKGKTGTYECKTSHSGYNYYVFVPKSYSDKKKIDDRIEAVLALAKELGQDDPLLCNYYGNVFALQLGTHPKAKELKELLAEARKRPGYAAVPPLFVPFATNLKSMFSGAALAPAATKFLEDVKAKAGEKSLMGKMATEFLAM